MSPYAGECDCEETGVIESGEECEHDLFAKIRPENKSTILTLKGRDPDECELECIKTLKEWGWKCLSQ